MSDPIPLARPSIGDDERAAIERVLSSGRLVLGPENAAFEQELAAACGRKYAVAVGSGTAALELSLSALEISRGDEVVICGFGFPAAANLVARLGAVPVPAPVLLSTWNLDVDRLEEVVTGSARAVVAVDQFGLVSGEAALTEFCRDRGLPLIDDAACALGGRSAGGVAGGGYGELGTLSFHPRKLITSGEGGAVVCDSPELLRKLRAHRNHGQVSSGSFELHGTNARLDEISAAIGRVQLSRVGAFVDERGRLARGYSDALAAHVDSDRLAFQHVPAGARHPYQTLAVLLAESVDRSRVIEVVRGRGIEVGIGTYSFHRLPTFADSARVALPAADALHDRVLALPLYSGMTEGEVARVADAVSEALA